MKFNILSKLMNQKCFCNILNFNIASAELSTGF